ncbi:MAG: FAD-dependent oxidoreductase [Gammaproteobacteria bacterium]|nr:FAD-dependent oxidoreductase [Gammaproteobacteria bacterium]
MSSQQIAIIGSGISGLTAAHLLSRQHQVTLFEANDYIGGHTHTVNVELEKENLDVDTGFIVCNNRNYPNFLKFMRQLAVKLQKTEMSFSVRNDALDLEYNGHNLNTLFAQRRNLYHPGFYRLVLDILRFNRESKATLLSDKTAGQTLLQFVKDRSFSATFVNNYLLPMVAAIWSCSLAQAEKFPLGFFLRFFNHHGLLDIRNRPQWYVLKGGSHAYIKPITRPFAERIHCRSPVSAVRRRVDCVELDIKGTTRIFDQVILACHSNQALSILQDANDKETRILGAMAYQENDVILHTDQSLMPIRSAAWASWNFIAGGAANDEPPLVTYCMNILQGLHTKIPLLVSLNARHRIAPDKILQEFTYAHPVYSLESSAAQQDRASICGVNRTHFCGAYWYNGFHEDGVCSALDVTARFGESLS